jgi:acyl-coenzyme A thioesterase PaaI-like protein
MNVLTVEFKINLINPAKGDYLEATGQVVKSGRTLTVCQLEVFAVAEGSRSLVAIGQQTLIAVPDRT